MNRTLTDPALFFTVPNSALGTLLLLTLKFLCIRTIALSPPDDG